MADSYSQSDTLPSDQRFLYGSNLMSSYSNSYAPSYVPRQNWPRRVMRPELGSMGESLSESQYSDSPDASPLYSFPTPYDEFLDSLLYDPRGRFLNPPLLRSPRLNTTYTVPEDSIQQEGFGTSGSFSSAGDDISQWSALGIPSPRPPRLATAADPFFQRGEIQYSPHTSQASSSADEWIDPYLLEKSRYSETSLPPPQSQSTSTLEDFFAQPDDSTWTDTSHDDSPSFQSSSPGQQNFMQTMRLGNPQELNTTFQMPFSAAHFPSPQAQSTMKLDNILPQPAENTWMDTSQDDSLSFQSSSPGQQNLMQTMRFGNLQGLNTNLRMPSPPPMHSAPQNNVELMRTVNFNEYAWGRAEEPQMGGYREQDLMESTLTTPSSQSFGQRASTSSDVSQNTGPTPQAMSRYQTPANLRGMRTLPPGLRRGAPVSPKRLRSPPLRTEYGSFTTTPQYKTPENLRSRVYMPPGVASASPSVSPSHAPKYPPLKTQYGTHFPQTRRRRIMTESSVIPRRDFRFIGPLAQRPKGPSDGRPGQTSAASFIPRWQQGYTGTAANYPTASTRRRMPPNNMPTSRSLKKNLFQTAPDVHATYRRIMPRSSFIPRRDVGFSGPLTQHLKGQPGQTSAASFIPRWQQGYTGTAANYPTGSMGGRHTTRSLKQTLFEAPSEDRSIEWELSDLSNP